jgi:hypothetical protein
MFSPGFPPPVRGAYYRFMDYGYDYVGEYSRDKGDIFSVRCVRNN